MPSTSKAQQMAAGIALSAKRGNQSPGKLRGSSKQMYKSMSTEQLRHFASTPRRSLPNKKKSSHS